MSELNLFDYVFLFLPIIVLSILLVKGVGTFLDFIKYRRLTATVIEVVSDNNITYRKSYKYIVRYEVDGMEYVSKLSGYSSPYSFLKNEHVKISVNKINPLKIFALTLKGKISLLLTIILVLALSMLGVFHFFDKIGLYPVDATLYNLIPLVFILLSFNMLVEQYLFMIKFKSRSLSAVGTIKNYFESKDIDNVQTFKPIIEFYDQLNNAFLFTSNLHHIEKQVGKKIKIFYDRDNPNIVEVDSFLVRWAESIFWLIVFVLCITFVVL